MCHQTVGLIARAIEDAGVPTLSMSSARDITRSAWPARSVYLDYPLGHTAGRPNQPELNASIMRDTLAAFESLTEPGAMTHLNYRWSDTDDWKDKVFVPVEATESGGESSEYEDDRTARHETPQYQTEDDHAAAALTHDSEECLVCAGIDY